MLAVLKSIIIMWTSVSLAFLDRYNFSVLCVG